MDIESQKSLQSEVFPSQNDYSISENDEDHKQIQQIQDDESIRIQKIHKMSSDSKSIVTISTNTNSQSSSPFNVKLDDQFLLPTLDLNQRPKQQRSKPFTQEEDDKLLSLIEKNGKNWKFLLSQFPGKTQQMIRNRYYAKIRKIKKQDLQKDLQSTISIESSKSFKVKRNNKQESKKHQNFTENLWEEGQKLDEFHKTDLFNPHNDNFLSENYPNKNDMSQESRHIIEKNEFSNEENCSSINVQEEQFLDTNKDSCYNFLHDLTQNENEKSFNMFDSKPQRQQNQFSINDLHDDNIPFNKDNFLTEHNLELNINNNKRPSDTNHKQIFGSENQHLNQIGDDDLEDHQQLEKLSKKLKKDKKIEKMEVLKSQVNNLELMLQCCKDQIYRELGQQQFESFQSNINK